VLDRVFSDSIDLPFNAYEHPEKVTFDDPAFPPKQFSFDLSGNFRRVDASAVTGSKAVELFVEVKSYSEGSQLLAEYDEFLRRAAIVGSTPRHRNSWFMFLSSVPFGTTFGVRLCDGGFLTERSQSWTGGIQPPQDLHLRTCVGVWQPFAKEGTQRMGPVEMISSIAAASTWNEYYEAHRAIYLTIVQKRWALGTPSFAHHIHHPAVPDTSGVVVRVINWAAYSQVTAANLGAFTQVFQGLLEREPQRKSTRYFLFTRAAPTPARTAISDLTNAGVDVWQDSFESALAVPQQLGPLDSLNAFFGSNANVVFARRAVATPSEFVADKFEVIRAAAQEAAQSATASVIPQLLRSVLIDSCIVLTAFRCGVRPAQVAAWLDPSAAIAARVAAERAEESGWEPEAQQFCDAIVAIAPPMEEIYTVRPNDILSRVVREKYGLSFYQVWPLISAINPGLDPDRIFPKQEIALPVITR
jgi:hypothetical protein